MSFLYLEQAQGLKEDKIKIMSLEKNEELVFRRADPEDLQEVYSFVCTLEEKEMNYEKFCSRFRNQVISPDILLLLAERAGKPVGFLSCHLQNVLHHDGDIYEIVEFIVSPEYRGSGVGKKMLGFLDLQLKDRDYELIELASNVRRDRAHQFYEQQGFNRSHFKFTKYKQ